MRVSEFAGKMGMTIETGSGGVDKEITGVYAGDLLSFVMSNAGTGNAWITVLTSLNIIAVALLAEISCIIIPQGITVEEKTLKKAESEDIPILSTAMDTYEICWRAHQLMGAGKK
jgi:predicted transcriptional regulator